MSKIYKLLVLLTIVSCGYSSSDNIDKNIDHVYNCNSIINNSNINTIHNIEENNNCNNTDKKTHNKTPEFVENFIFSQNILENMIKFLTTKISSNEMEQANKYLFSRNKDKLNEANTRIDLVNKLFARDIEDNTDKYIEGQFRIKPFMYGKWKEVNTKQKLHDSCFNVIKKLIIHSDLEKAKLGVTQNIRDNILFGSIQENEIQNIISILEKEIIKESENKKIDIEYIVNNILNTSNIININNYLLSNIKKERVNLYLSLLRNILVQYGNNYSYLLKDNNVDYIILVNEHFNPFGEEDTQKKLGKAYNMLYTTCNRQICDNNVTVEVEGIERNFTKYVSLYPEDDTEQYYLSVINNKTKFILPTLFNKLITQNNNITTKNYFNKLMHIKSLLYANYLLRYFNLKFANYNYASTCNQNSWFNHIKTGDTLINDYLEKNPNDTFNEAEKSLIKNIINEINRISNSSNNESKNKRESIVQTIRHIKKNIKLTSDGKMKRITNKDLSYRTKIEKKNRIKSK